MFLRLGTSKCRGYEYRS